MSDRLLPVGSSVLEVAAADALAQITRVPVPLRSLWNPQTCPVSLLPYLAWALSVDRWDENWPEETKRSVIASSFYVHLHKGTNSALRRIVETLGYEITIIEWWQVNGEPGTFRLAIDVLNQGMSAEQHHEIERLIDVTKPASRHMTGLDIRLGVVGEVYVGAGCYFGDSLTVYPDAPTSVSVGGEIYLASAAYIPDDTMTIYPGAPDVISVADNCYTACAVHLIDNVRVF